MNAHVDPLTQIPLKLIDSFSSVVLLSPFAEELGLNRHHGTEETSSRFAQEGSPEEEVGEAPQEVQAPQQQEEGAQAQGHAPGRAGLGASWLWRALTESEF